MNEKTLTQMSVEERSAAITAMTGEDRLTAILKQLGKRIHSGRPIKNAVDADVPETKKLKVEVDGSTYLYIKTKDALGSIYDPKAKKLTECSVEVFEAFWAELEDEDQSSDEIRAAVITALKGIPSDIFKGIELVTFRPEKLDSAKVTKKKTVVQLADPEDQPIGEMARTAGQTGAQNPAEVLT